MVSLYIFVRYIEKFWVNRVNKKIGKSEGLRDHRKVKSEIHQTLVMIALYVKFNVHSSYAKQVIVVKMAEDGPTTIAICQNFGWGKKLNAIIKKNKYNMPVKNIPS